MEAEKALKHSESKLIVADTLSGVVAILQHSAEGAPQKSFEVRFLPRCGGEQPNGSKMVTIGSYDDLDVAVTIAAVKYGVCDNRWFPVTQMVFGSRSLG